MRGNVRRERKPLASETSIRRAPLSLRRKWIQAVGRTERILRSCRSGMNLELRYGRVRFCTHYSAGYLLPMVNALR